MELVSEYLLFWYYFKILVGYIMRVKTLVCIAYYKSGSAVVSKWQGNGLGRSLTFLKLIF